MKTYKTPKGTELQIMNIKGKDYLQVPQRVIWFREEHPTGQIFTESVVMADNYAIFKATVHSNDGIILATSHKREDASHFPDFMEKAETGAIGRALALCGYGTAFAHDFDEGERLADAPIPPPVKRETSDNLPDFTSHTSVADYVIRVGTKFKDKKVGSIPDEELAKWTRYLDEGVGSSGKPLTGATLEAYTMVMMHLNRRK